MDGELTILKAADGDDTWSDLLPWLKRSASIYLRYVKGNYSNPVEEKYFPFHGNEQCAVSLLLAGASAAGYFALMECDVEKGNGFGRADLWILAAGKNYWFEFKRSAYNPLATKWGLDHAFREVNSDIEKLYMGDGEIGVSCVIGATDNMKPEYRKAYSDFLDKVDFAVRLGEDSEDGVILFFSKLKDN